MILQRVIICLVLPGVYFAFALPFVGAVSAISTPGNALLAGTVFALTLYGLNYPVLRAILKLHSSGHRSPSLLLWILELAAFVIASCIMAFLGGPDFDVTGFWRLAGAGIAYIGLERLVFHIISE